MENCVIALGQGHDEIVNPGRLGGGNHLLPGGVFPAVGDVFINGAGKQPGILEDHAVSPAEGGPGHRPDLLSIHLNAPGLGIIKPHQQIDDGGLPRSRGPHNGHQRAGPGQQVKVPDHRLSRVIAKGHPIQSHFSLHLGQLPGLRSVGWLWFCIYETKDPLRCSKGALELSHNVGHLIDGTGELPGVLNKAGQVPQLNPTGQVQQRPKDADQSQGQVVDAVHSRAHNGAVGLRLGVGVHRLAVFLVKGLQNCRLLAIGLGGLLAVHHLLRKTIELPQGGASPPEEGPHPGGDVPGEEYRGGNGDAENEHQLRRNGQHHPQGHGHRHHRLKNL